MIKLDAKCPNCGDSVEFDYCEVGMTNSEVNLECSCCETLFDAEIRVDDDGEFYCESY